jgi:hypothetical protein
VSRRAVSGMRGQDRDAGDENAGDHPEKYRQQEWN